MEVTHDHIRVMTYNTTAVAYVRNTGGSHSLPCNDITRQIWQWCLPRNIWVSISNVIAAQASMMMTEEDSMDGLLKEARHSKSASAKPSKTLTLSEREVQSGTTTKATVSGAARPSSATRTQQTKTIGELGLVELDHKVD